MICCLFQIPLETCNVDDPLTDRPLGTITHVHKALAQVLCLVVAWIAWLNHTEGHRNWKQHIEPTAKDVIWDTTFDSFCQLEDDYMIVLFWTHPCQASKMLHDVVFLWIHCHMERIWTATRRIVHWKFWCDLLQLSIVKGDSRVRQPCVVQPKEIAAT